MSKTKKKPSVTVIIPALNEEKNIKKVIVDCLKIKGYAITVLVVVDSKTTDKTDLVSKKAGAKVVYGKGIGKGSNIKSSVPHIRTDYVIQIDADYQFMPYEIPKMILPLENGYDVTLGTRYQKGSKIEVDSVSHLRLYGSYGLSFITSIFAMQRVSDVMAGFKAFKTNVFRNLNPQTSHFGYEAELVVRAAKKKYKIINVPITYKKRAVGKSSVSSFKDGFLVLGSIIKTAMESSTK